MKFDKIDPLIWLLFGGMVLYTFALFVAEVRFESDGVFFQVISNILSAFVASLFTAIKLKNVAVEPQPPTIDNPATTSTTTVTRETVTAKPDSLA